MNNEQLTMNNDGRNSLGISPEYIKKRRIIGLFKEIPQGFPQPLFIMHC